MKKTKNGMVTSTLKAVTIGPIATISVLSVVYLVWWATSKVFYMLHGQLTESVFPWIKENWGVSIIIWIFLAITSIFFVLLFNREKKEKIRTAPTASTSTIAEENNQPQTATTTPDIYVSRQNNNQANN